MPDLLLKDFSPDDLDRLTQVARAAGLDRMNWAKGVLLQAASAPLVRKRYAADQAARALIRRNAPGDRERALRLLHEAGFELLEIPV